MPVNYGILRGRVINFIPYQAGTDHFQIEIKAGQLYRIAVDVYSQFAGTRLAYAADSDPTLDTNRMVMYYKDEHFEHPLTAQLLQAGTGFTPKAQLPAALCLDYLRTQPVLFPIEQMKVVAPKSGNQPGENLNSDIAPWVQKALNNQDAEVFAFGSGWDDNTAGSHPDTRKYFHPDPSVGIHDIHMNQGDTGKEAKYNGINQDGALLFHFAAENQWVAMFFRFQNQSLHTDDKGNAV